MLNKDTKVPNVIDYKNYIKNTIIGCLSEITDKDKKYIFEMTHIGSNQDIET